MVARYAVGCDGARSIVAEAGGFELEGEAGLGNAITVWIEADLARYTQHRSGALFVVCNPGSDDVVSIWTCIEPWNEWSTIFVRHGMAAQDLSEEAVLPRVRAAIGDDDVEVRIKHISPWEFNHVVASGYRRGRLFIAGDAAHRHPPANGLGSNTSVQDAYNLAWKLALVVQGRAGESLLDSYDAERQPVGRQVVDRANQSVGEMAAWLGPIGLRGGQTVEEAHAELDAIFGPDGEERRLELLKGLEVMNAQFNAHGVELDQRYESSAVVGDGTPFPAPDRDPELYHHAVDPPRLPAPPRLARPRHPRRVDPRPLRLRALHPHHRRRRRGVGGRPRRRSASSSAWRSGPSGSPSARRTTTCTATGPGAARSPTAAACWSDPTASSPGAATTSPTTPPPRSPRP